MEKQYRPRLSEFEWSLVQRARGFESSSNSKIQRNVLVIGDIHEPFCEEGYLEHCIAQYEKYKCTDVVFIGDVIDSHYSSFHRADPDGYGAGDELERAIDRIQQWYAAFPKALVCIGNHDAIVRRKAFDSGISKCWIRDYDEMLGVDGWDFQEHHKLDGVLYVHGTGTSGRSAAVNKAVQFGMNCVQGHIHTEASVIYGGNHWGMQVGCGVDRHSYAMAYAKYFAKTYKLSCGVVLSDGTFPIVIPFTSLRKE
jgi:predicted phosphodiesterase